MRGSALFDQLEVPELVVAVLAEQLLRLGLNVQSLRLQLPQTRFRFQPLSVSVSCSLELTDYLMSQLCVSRGQVFLAFLVQNGLGELVH